MPGEVAPLFEQTLSKRSRSRLIVIDEDCRIVLGEPAATRMLEPEIGLDGNGQTCLNGQLCRLIKQRLNGFNDHGTTVEHGRLLLHLFPVNGTIGKFIAVTVETLRQREDLLSQSKQYRLTAREIDVLRLMLKGLTAYEMAEILNITKNTVTDYFKSLQRKTNARNRSDMIAKILGWEGKAVSSSPRRKPKG